MYKGSQHLIWTDKYLCFRQHLIYSITPDSGPTQVKKTSHLFTDINFNTVDHMNELRKKIIGIGIQHLGIFSFR
jgi:hypothetical protein